ncbi:hypothetical protein DM860_015746 [Cuscuta australis]|uniref:VWFA domain-containing protein n=1 Tax=Cuscuta australis TaxID=267555 RepID=A0A328DU95_9ASTE|nr:hypothetical protein DM860_015746 [Cuscuta australis]
MIHCISFCPPHWTTRATPGTDHNTRFASSPSLSVWPLLLLNLFPSSRCWLEYGPRHSWTAGPSVRPWILSWFDLDVSGSMSGEKLALVKQAVHFVVDNLGPSDRLSIVSFATHAKRVLRLTLMTDHGRDEARCAVNSLSTKDTTNIVAGLKTAVKVLEERRHRNPVATILFLSDGNDNCNGSSSFRSRGSRKAPDYLHLLPASICPKNKKAMGEEYDVIKETFPVHAFGFGSDHDPVAMHAIAEASDGTFSFIESIIWSGTRCFC